MAEFKAGITGIDHVQLAMPPGAEETARGFFHGVLGLTEVPKPPHLAVGGGVWFQCGAGQIHLGGEKAFIPAKKAHPALIVAGFDEFVGTLARSGVEIHPADPVAGRQRASIYDPFGNKVELIEQA